MWYIMWYILALDGGSSTIVESGRLSSAGLTALRVVTPGSAALNSGVSSVVVDPARIRWQP